MKLYVVRHYKIVLGET